MTKQQGLRATAVLYLVGSVVPVLCFAFDLYLLIARHPVGDRRFWDLAYLPIYAGGAFFFISGYRRFRTQMASHDPAIDAK
jgi:hypothetical protein